MTDGPFLDGVMDEPVWQTAAIVDQFIQQEPNEGEPATERTEICLIYDDSRLYVGVRAFDSESGVVATEMRRDSDRILDEDNFQIILDTFSDSRSAYMFVTNPLGAKLEQQIFEEGEGGRAGFRGSTNSNVNRDWDGVWYVSTRRTAEGWTAEIAIPMVTLRFPDVERQEWGINFMRNIRRKNEQVFWAPVPKPYTLTRVSVAGTVTGLASLNRGLDLRFKPFVVGGGRRITEAGSALDSTESDVGLDLKYGVGAGLNLDITVNTDFAQAEVDEEQVNLTRFPLFFPEKREFFLENAGQFNVGARTSFGRLADLFFSRRIGLSESGTPIPILGGARLTGKVGRHNVAMMNLQTDGAFGRAGENFMVARYSRDIFSRSKVGGIIINKQAFGRDDQFNRTFAADTTLALHPAFSISGYLAKSSSPSVTDSELSGHVRAAWLDQAWNLFVEYTDIQDNFNAEVGFVPRAGIRTTKVHFERNPRPGKFGIRVLEPMWNITYTTDQHNRLLTRRHHYMLGTRLENGGYLNIWYNDYFEQLDDPFPIQTDVVIPPGAYRFGEWRFMFTSDPSRRFYSSVSYSPQTFFDGTRTDVSASLGVRLTTQFAAEGGYQRNDVDLPWGVFSVDLGTVRLDYALSPRMTLRSLSQYNSSTEQVSTSVRFNFIYRPGSDIYVVYDEVRRDPTGLATFRDRQLLLKFTYLLSR